MERVIKILMARDGYDRDEATMYVNAFLKDAESYIECGDIEGLEDLLMDDLGLEPDYLPALLGLY